MNYKKYELRELIKIKNGKDYRNEKKGLIPVYGTGGIVDYIDKHIYNGESILLPRKGSLNNIEYIDGKFWTIDTMYWTKINKNIVYGKFLFLYLSLLNITKRNTGSTLPSMTFETYYSLKIPLPEYEKQKKIADFIFMILDKIKNNSQINNNLEELAFNIYLHDFLGKKKNGKLENIIIENLKSSIQVRQAKDKKGQFPFFTSGDSVLEWSDFMVEGRNLYLNTGGNADVKFYVGKASYSTDTWCITANDNMADYLYLMLKSIKVELNKKFFQGSGLKHLQKPLLKQEKIYIPSKEEITEFNKVVQPMFDMIASNTRENKHLTELRDFLLPMLMNGQIDVDDVEI